MDNDFEQKFRQDVRAQVVSDASGAPAQVPRSKTSGRLNWSVILCVVLSGTVLVLIAMLVLQNNRVSELEEELEYCFTCEEEEAEDINDETVYDENSEADIPDEDLILEGYDEEDTEDEEGEGEEVENEAES